MLIFMVEIIVLVQVVLRGVITESAVTATLASIMIMMLVSAVQQDFRRIMWELALVTVDVCCVQRENKVAMVQETVTIVQKESLNCGLVNKHAWINANQDMGSAQTVGVTQTKIVNVLLVQKAITKAQLH